MWNCDLHADNYTNVFFLNNLGLTKIKSLRNYIWLESWLGVIHDYDVISTIGRDESKIQTFCIKVSSLVFLHLLKVIEMEYAIVIRQESFFFQRNCTS